MFLTIRKFATIILTTAIPGACTVVPQQMTEDSHNDPFHGTAVQWHQGSVESAFKNAQSNNQLVFLYWGANWCPPCNEMKSQIFVKPQFAEMMKGFIPVYLDGDSDNAQTWGEWLNVSGYPTLLVLNGQKNELMRLSDGISINDLELMLTNVKSAQFDLGVLIDNALSGQATPAHWQTLANISWYDHRKLDLTSDDILRKRLQLFDQIPSNLTQEKALLAARLLESVVTVERKNSAVITTIRDRSTDLIAAMTVDQNAIYSSRLVLINGAASTTDFAFANQPEKLKLIEEKWLTAVDRLSQDARLTVDQRLWVNYPQIQFAIRRHPKSPLPLDLIKKVKAAVEAANAASQTGFERQSVIPGAGLLLAEAQQHDDAMQLLESEVGQAQAPFYFYSALARIATMAGDLKKASLYQQKASNAAEGRATRMQWLEQEITQLSKHKDAASRQRQKVLIEKFYESMFAFRDGFAGRAYRSSKKVALVLSKSKLGPEATNLIKNYSYRCLKLSGNDKIRCDDHFQSIVAGK